MGKQLVALATDEKNIVAWDIDALLSSCKELPCTLVDTEKITPKSWLTIDEAYAITTNVNSTIILFELPYGLLFVADGNHRLYKAATEKIAKMKILIIPENIHLSYLYECSPETYRKVIEDLRKEEIFIKDFRKA